jgi:hypothetical protein
MHLYLYTYIFVFTGFKKSIIPTDIIFQVGLHVSGACKLSYPYNGCPNKSNDLCYRGDNNTNYDDNIQYFDDPVLHKDVKEIDMDTEGCIYHMMVNAAHELISNITDINVKNDYSLIYFPLVHQELKKRKLDLLIDIPLSGGKVPYDERNWVNWDIVYRSRNTMESLLPEDLS